MIHGRRWDTKICAQEGPGAPTGAQAELGECQDGREAARIEKRWMVYLFEIDAWVVMQCQRHVDRSL